MSITVENHGSKRQTLHRSRKPKRSHLQTTGTTQGTNWKHHKTFHLKACPQWKLHLPNLPRQHPQLVTMCPNTQAYGGHLLFKPPQHMEKMLNVNQNHNEIPLCTHLRDYAQQTLARMWRNWKPHPLLMGVWNGSVTLENDMEIPPKLNKKWPQTSNSIPRNLPKKYEDICSQKNLCLTT